MRPIRHTNLLPLCAAIALLSACGDDPAVEEVDEGTVVTGEVLEGSISDAMVPLDELRSQAPHAAIVPNAGGAAGSSSDAVDNPAAETPETSAAGERGGEPSEPAVPAPQTETGTD